MTMQASEIISYRGEQYCLFANPLYSYLVTRNDISFDLYTTAHWRGYQGYWKLEDDKLYLTDVESVNHSIQTIFQTSDPVLAEWFTGTIEIGFGEATHTEWNITYENYLWLKLDNGIVSDKKIIKQIDNNYIFDFGKYKGKTILDVVKGKINTTFNREHLFKEYFAEVINFFINKEYNKRINIPYFNITEDTKTTLNDIKTTTVKYLLTTNFIAIEKHFYVNSTGEEETEKFSQILEDILTSDFNLLRTIFKKEFPVGDIEERTFLINGDISYIEWAIKKIENFSIPPHIIVKDITQKFLRKFEIKRLNSTIFEYKPVIEEIIIKLNDETKKVNLEKFQNKFEVIYDFENDIYIENLSEEELYNKFGYYLDENSQLIVEEEEYEEEEFDYQDNDNQYSEQDYFDAMTDGQLGDYDEFIDNGGDIDDIDTWARG